MMVSFPLSMVLLLSITSHLWGECICIIWKHVRTVVNDLVSPGCSSLYYARRVIQLQCFFLQDLGLLSSQSHFLYLQRYPPTVLLQGSHACTAVCWKMHVTLLQMDRLLNWSMVMHVWEAAAPDPYCLFCFR